MAKLGNRLWQERSQVSKIRAETLGPTPVQSCTGVYISSLSLQTFPTEDAECLKDSGQCLTIAVMARLPEVFIE